MSFPVVGQTVKALKGEFAGEYGIVRHIDEGEPSPLYVSFGNRGPTRRFAPDEVEVPTGNALTECSALHNVSAIKPHPEFNHYSGAAQAVIVGDSVWLTVTSRLNEGHTAGVSMSLEQWENFRKLGDDM